MPEARSNRFSLVIVLFLLAALAIAGKLVYLQVFKAKEYSAAAQNEYQVDLTLDARRGTIYDRNGTVLAISVDATTIYANPKEITDPTGFAVNLAASLGGKASDYVELLTQDTTFVYIKRKADVEVAEEVEAYGMPGIYFIDDTKREYPCGIVGGQIIGVCGVDGEGLCGLELYYDDILAGTPGTYVADIGLDNMPIPGGVHEETPAIDGTDIVISLDIEMQEVLEKNLKKMAKTTEAKGATGLIYDGATGEIYAAASLPLFNPADLSKVEEGATSLKCITGALEPGSAFKTVSAMSLLENEAMKPSDKIFCPSYIEADGYKVSDSHDRDDETMTLSKIIADSSNVGISLSVEKMGFDKFYEKILAYNMTESTGVDYPGEATGYLSDFDTWAKIQGYNVTFGQGISVTPLQITRFYGALVNNGVECTPHFLMSKPKTGEQVKYKTADVIENKDAIAPMVKMLRGVVKKGTGTAAAIDGVKVAGKTSTAEIASDSGGYLEGVYNLAFVGFIADSSSELVCYVGANDVPHNMSVTSTFSDIMSVAVDRYRITSN